MEKPSETNEDLLAENERLRAELASLRASGCRFFESGKPLLEDLENSCAIVNSVQDAVYKIDTNGVILSLNPAFETITGLRREEWVGKTFGPLVHPDDFSRVAEHFAQAAAGVTASMYEARFVTQSGEYKIGQFATAPYMQNGKVIAVIGIARDITEHKKAEDEIRESEERYRKLVEISPDMIAVAVRGKIEYANSAFVEGHGGNDPSQFIGKEIGQFIRQEDRAKVKDRFRKQIETGLPAPLMESRFLRLDGTEFSGEAVATPFTYKGVPAVQVIIRDITERKLAEVALRKSEERFRAIAETAKDSIFIKDSDRRYTYVNKSMVDLLGCRTEDLLGKTPEEIFGKESAKTIEEVDKVAFEGETADAIRSLMINGQENFFYTIQVPLTANRSEVTEICGIVRDITEQRQAEEALRESEERYRGLVDAVFEGIAIHEKGIILEANNVLARMFGYKLSEAIGMSVLDMTAPESREKLLQKIQSGYEKPYEALGLKKDGSTFPVELTGKNIHYKGRKARVTVLRDITERKRSEILVKTQRDLGLALAGKHDLNRTLRMCLDAALDVSGMDCGGIYLTNETGGLNLAYHTGLSKAFVEKNSQHSPDTPNTRLIMEGKPVYGRHSALDVPISETNRREELRGLAIIPIIDEGRVIACLNMASHVVDEIDEFTRVSLETIALQIRDLFVQSINAEALRSSEERFRSIVTDSPDIIVVADEDGRVEFINKTLNFHTTEEVIGMAFYDFVLPEFHDVVRKAIEKLFETGQSVRYETKASDPNGTISDYETRCMPLLRDGKVRSFISVTSDVTERRRAEEALKDSEERLRTVVTNSTPIVFMCDKAGRILLSEGRMLASMGLRPGQDVGNNVFESYRDYPEVIEGIKRALDGEMFEGLIALDGLFYEVFYSPYRNSRGEVIGIIGMALDVTSRVQAEEEKLALERQLLQAQKMESLGILAGGIAHDFNNLLVGVLGNAEMALLDLKPESPIRSYLQDIQTASIRLGDLTQQMLAYTGKANFVVEMINLSSLVEEMVHLLESSISKKVTLKYEPSDIPHAITADANQIRQVVMNLITNASEACEGRDGGKVKLRTGKIEVDESMQRQYLLEDKIEGERVFLEVSDNGCGMNEETLKKIFDPFYSTKFTGRGLGLASVLGILRSHCGNITVDSKLNQGTTIMVLFPHEEVECNEFIKESTEESSYNAHGKILLVDDEENVLNIGAQMLERVGFTVLTAADGVEAVEQVQEHATELVCVLLDLTMPRMNGNEAFTEIRRIRKDLPIILCSGYDHQKATKVLEAQDLTGFLQKPYRYRKMVEKLQEFLK